MLTYSNFKEYIPNGSQTLSKMPERYTSNYPSILSRGKEGHVWDAEGREYIDLISGLGCISIGYADLDVNEAIKQQIAKGVNFSFSSSIEYDTSKKLTQLIPFTEMWKFAKSGTEANVYAVRAARAYTGRERIMTVGYNGCADIFECKGVRNAGIPKDMARYNTRANYNDIGSFASLLLEEYACVLMEPMVEEYPKEGFLQQVRDLCTKTGTLLIFDEVVTGGRFEGFVASNYFKIEPDIITLSKGIANGLPLSAVGGRRTIMQTFERDDFFASGTFNGECVSLAACLTALEKLNQAIPETIAKGKEIQDYFNQFPWNARCVGYPTRLNFKFDKDEDKYLFWQEMCKERVLLGYNNFVMVNHTPKDIETIKQAIYTSWYRMKKGCKLEGPLPISAVIRS